MTAAEVGRAPHPQPLDGRAAVRLANWRARMQTRRQYRDLHAQVLERLAQLSALLLGTAEAFGEVGRQDHRDVQRPGFRCHGHLYLAARTDR